MSVPPITSQHVREALENLYANVELANTPIAQMGRFVDTNVGIIQRAQAIRNILLDAIESLRPVRSLHTNQAQAGRSYEVLSLRYVSNLTIEEIGERLTVGSRQIYRDLRRAEEELSALLDSPSTSGYLGSQMGDVSGTHASAFKAELDALTRHQDVVELSNLLHSAVRMVQTLAKQKGVTLHYHPPLQSIPITAPPSLVKEVMIQLLSALVQQSGPGQLLVIRTQREEDYVEVQIKGYSNQPGGDDGTGFAWENPLLQNALLLAQLLEMTSMVRPPEARELIIRFDALPLSVASQTILIAEDNPGVRELYQRYLQGSQWRAILLANPDETFAAVQELRPAAIILDVLMPGIDGWSVLQTLRATPELADIPIIICSVINDPELALALGAAASLKKPLSRLELMDALQQVTRGQGMQLRM